MKNISISSFFVVEDCWSAIVTLCRLRTLITLFFLGTLTSVITSLMWRLRTLKDSCPHSLFDQTQTFRYQGISMHREG